MDSVTTEPNGRSPSPTGPTTTNGVHAHDDSAATTDAPDTVDALRAELARVQAEKDGLSEQYSVLVGKLNTMRTSVANKLKQDAVRSFK
jgi:hypothetical protein